MTETQNTGTVSTRSTRARVLAGLGIALTLTLCCVMPTLMLGGGLAAMLHALTAEAWQWLIIGLPLAVLGGGYLWYERRRARKGPGGVRR